LLIRISRVTILHDICTVINMNRPIALLLFLCVSLAFGQIDNNIGNPSDVSIPFGNDTSSNPNISDSSLSTPSYNMNSKL